MQKTEPQKVRADLTAEEKERLARYGAIEFKSAGATRAASATRKNKSK